MATQMDVGFIGMIALEGTLRLALQCRDTSDVPTTPTGSPSWSIYGSSDTAVLTGSLGGSDADSKTGFRTGDAAITAANGFASGGRYIIRFAFVISGTTYAAVGYFVVDESGQKPVPPLHGLIAPCEDEIAGWFLCAIPDRYLGHQFAPCKAL